VKKELRRDLVLLGCGMLRYEIANNFQIMLKAKWLTSFL